MTDRIVDNTQESRFELRSDGALAFANYRRKPDRLVLTHFETEAAARGRGLAGRLMAAIVEEARRQKLGIEPRCSYAVAWFERNPAVAAEIEARPS
jgi:predicted GNAT family acetyltransferase